MSHHIAVYVDREKTLILSVFSKFSSHLKDNSWLLFYFQMQSICFSTLLNSEPSNYTVLILYSQKKTNVSFWAFLIYSFVFLNLLPTALNNCEGTTGNVPLMLLCPSLIRALMDRANVTRIIIKNSKKKSKPPQNSDNTYKMEQNKTQIVCVWFPFPFFKSL